MDSEFELRCRIEILEKQIAIIVKHQDIADILREQGAELEETPNWRTRKD